MLAMFSSSPDQEQTHTAIYETISVEGRKTFVYLPDLLRVHDRNETSAKTHTRAIIFLHGSECVAEDYFNQGFDKAADNHNFVIAFAEMIVPWGENWGYPDDLSYFEKLVFVLKEIYHAEEIYVCGHSAGASMSFYLQNQLNHLIRGAGAISGGVSRLPLWNLSIAAKPTLMIFNIRDPVLADWGGEEVYNETVQVMAGKDYQTPRRSQALPVGGNVTAAELLIYNGGFSAIRWNSTPPTHKLPHGRSMSFDAAEQLIKFWNSATGLSGSNVKGVIL